MLLLITAMLLPPKLVPVTVRLWLVEAVPLAVLKPDSALVLTRIAGTLGLVTVPVTDTERGVAPVLEAAMVLVKVPAFVPVRRT